MIDPEGVIVWALPSHQEFLIYKAMVRFGYSREVLMAACPPEFYYDFLRWLIPMSGGWIPVWKQGVMDYPVTKKQHAALKKTEAGRLFQRNITTSAEIAKTPYRQGVFFVCLFFFPQCLEPVIAQFNESKIGERFRAVFFRKICL